MRWIAKIFLWLLSVAIPVVIAACYGPPYRYSKSGKVVDTESKLGIDGIRVSCYQGATEQDSAWTYQGGEFTLWYDTPCETLHLFDEDGAENGAYQDRIVPFCESCDTMTIELTKEP